MPLSKKPIKAKLTKSETERVRKIAKMSGRSSGVKVVMPDGSTVGLKDLGKVKPTPKPKPKPSVIKPKEYTPAQYDALLRKAQKDAQKKR